MHRDPKLLSTNGGKRKLLLGIASKRVFVETIQYDKLEIQPQNR